MRDPVPAGAGFMRLGGQILMGALIVVSVLLLRQNLELRRVIAEFQPDLLQVGDVVPPFESPGLDGEVVVEFGPQAEKVRIFLYLSPECPFCADQMPYWRQLVDSIDANQFELIAIVRDTEDPNEVRRYVKGHGLARIPTVLASEEIWSAYKFLSTPTTLIVGHDGHVLEQWHGSWNVDTAREAGSLLGIAFTRDGISDEG